LLKNANARYSIGKCPFCSLTKKNMKFIDEFRNPEIAKKLIAKIHGSAEKLTSQKTIMEICGGHTVALFKFGIHELLPKKIKLVSGPGCPVCVTPNKIIDQAVWLAKQPKVKLFSFGDMMRVPGSLGTLADAADGGEKVKMIYSPMQAVDFAAKNPEILCVLFGVGFETTVPTHAAAVLAAKKLGLKNFSLLSAGKLTPPAMHTLLEDEKVKLDAFIAPGHVTTIIGANAYKFIEDVYKKPCVVSGFELCDLLESLVKIVDQLVSNKHEVEIQYSRTVTFEGNKKAREIIAEVLIPADTEWRGLGKIPESGFKVNDNFSDFNTEHTFKIPDFTDEEPAGCRCGDVLKGICSPEECSLFGNKCTPEYPVGPCMVSSEGSCGAHFRYGRE